MEKEFKNYIKLSKIPELKTPVLLAAWPGMGNVAIKSVIYIREKIGAIKFAEIEGKYFFYPSDVEVENGEIDIMNYPAGEFFYFKNKTGNDIVIFTSIAQPETARCYEYADVIIRFAKRLGIKFIYTFAAMPVMQEYDKKIEPRIWIAVTEKKVLFNIEPLNARILTSGRISGMNGLLLGVSKEYKIDGICILCEIPFYMVQMDNPRASIKLVSLFSKMENIQIDLTELKENAILTQKKIESFFEYFDFEKFQKIFMEQGNKEEEEEEEEENKILSQDSPSLDPQIRNRIETLFKEVSKDISKATELKKELDKYGIYKEYEDRFLDLFRPKNKKEKH